MSYRIIIHRILLFNLQNCVIIRKNELQIVCVYIVMQSKKNVVFFYKKSLKKNIYIIQKKTVFLCFFIIIYNSKAGKCFLILWSAYSCYIQVVKHYIQYVNCIFIDSETN